MEKNRYTDAPRRFTTLLLDADGTLLDFDEAERRGVSAVLRTHGIEPTPERILRYHQINLSYWKAFERGQIPKEDIFRCRYPHFFRELGREIDNDATERLYRRHLDACAAMLPGAEDICAYLKERYDLYLITNGVASTQYERMRMSGLDRFFTRMFISEEIGSQKPSREYFDRCLEEVAEKDRSRMLVIGDSLSSDIQGGKNAGIATCWVNLKPEESSPSAGTGGASGFQAKNGFQTQEIRPQAAGPEPDYEVHSLYDLKKFL